MPRTALILANGEPPPAELLAHWRARCAWFCCTDGAVRAALAAGHVPDTVLGDLDSAPVELPRAIERLHLAEQETTDLEKACYTALGRRFERLVVLGAGGRRWDQFVSNLSVLARYADRLALEAGDEHGWLTLHSPGEQELDLGQGTAMSLLPLPAAGGVSLRGVRWPLDDAELRLGGRDAISNEVTSPPVRLTFRSGVLGVYVVTPTA